MIIRLVPTDMIHTGAAREKATGLSAYCSEYTATSFRQTVCSPAFRCMDNQILFEQRLGLATDQHVGIVGELHFIGSSYQLERLDLAFCQFHAGISLQLVCQLKIVEDSIGENRANRVAQVARSASFSEIPEDSVA